MVIQPAANPLRGLPAAEPYRFGYQNHWGIGTQGKRRISVRFLLLQIRGLGPWSAEYFLVRGMSRPDRVPADDLGIRSVVGRYLGSGQRLTPQGTLRKLSAFRPYRGLAAFYLLAYERISKHQAG